MPPLMVIRATRLHDRSGAAISGLQIERAPRLRVAARVVVRPAGQSPQLALRPGQAQLRGIVSVSARQRGLWRSACNGQAKRQRGGQIQGPTESARQKYEYQRCDYDSCHDTKRRPHEGQRGTDD